MLVHSESDRKLRVELFSVYFLARSSLAEHGVLLVIRMRKTVQLHFELKLATQRKDGFSNIIGTNAGMFSM